MNSYFGTTVARRRLPHFRHSSASEPAANQPSTSRSEEQEISTTTGWVLLKQPDNQKAASGCRLRSAQHPVGPPGAGQSQLFRDLDGGLAAGNFLRIHVRRRRTAETHELLQAAAISFTNRQSAVAAIQ